MWHFAFLGFQTLSKVLNSTWINYFWGFRNLVIHCCCSRITMPPPSKFVEGEELGSPTNNLWVGNLPPEVIDSNLMELFAPYGSLDSLISYSSRTFAFVLFRRVEDAKAAKSNLQGAWLRGFQIRIEFARPVCQNWKYFILYFISLCGWVEGECCFCCYVIYPGDDELLCSVRGCDARYHSECAKEEAVGPSTLKKFKCQQHVGF